MRKQYISPRIETVGVTTECSLLAGSGPLPIDHDTILDSDDQVGSKDHKFNIWGDDEE